MLIRDKLLILFILCLVINSCEFNSENNYEINNRRKYVINNFRNYKDVYSQANDSLRKWTVDSLSLAKSLFNYSYRLDSIFIFNKDLSRFYTTINTIDNKNKGAVFDYIDDFGGAKVNGKWYFFLMGVYNPVRREDWQDSVYAPLTFDELSYVAYESHFKTLVKNINEGNLDKNEEIFKKRLFFDISGIKNITDERRKQFEDSVILAITKEKYKYKLDPKEIADIKQSIAESKLPANEPLVKPYSWWEKLKYGEKPFESKAWKNRKTVK